jgi:hypothetical protein
LPPELEALVAKMLTKAPDDRTPSAAWALAALERVPLPSLDGIEIGLTTHALPVAEPTPEPDEALLTEKWPLWVPILIAVVALAVAAAAIYFIGIAGDDGITP